MYYYYDLGQNENHILVKTLYFFVYLVLLVSSSGGRCYPVIVRQVKNKDSKKYLFILLFISKTADLISKHFTLSYKVFFDYLLVYILLKIIFIIMFNKVNTELIAHRLKIIRWHTPCSIFIHFTLIDSHCTRVLQKVML